MLNGVCRATFGLHHFLRRLRLLKDMPAACLEKIRSRNDEPSQLVRHSPLGLAAKAILALYEELNRPSENPLSTGP